MLRRVTLSLLVLALVLGAVVQAPADDVPDDVRKLYDKAQGYVAKGDLKKAYSALSKAKAKAPASVDFWELFVRVYRQLGKKEAVLWDKIVSKTKAKHPKSIVWPMLQYRLAESDEKRMEHLKAALATAPDTLEPKLLLARLHVANGDDDLAEEILDEILEKEPSNETALVTKGDLMIESGLSMSALDFAEETLAEHDLPGLHDLAARALVVIAENDAEKLKRAEEEAKKAVAGRADPRYVLTLAQILDLSDQTDAAVTLLSEHYAKSPSPSLAGRLGELAFRTGDYAKAEAGLAVAAAEGDMNAARALLACHTRRGLAKEARALIGVVKEKAEDGAVWAAMTELALGDAAAARKHLEGMEGDEGAYYRLYTYAWEGNAAEAAKLGAEKGADGSRGGEEFLLPVVEARLFQKLGAKAAAARKLLQDAGYAAGKAKVPSATVPEFEPSVTGHSFGFRARYVSYRRALNGHFFQSGGMFPVVPTQIDGEAAIGPGWRGTSECARDSQRLFPFNAQKMEGEIQIQLNENAEIWKEASEGFEKGCAALVKADYAAAQEGFAKALEKEPGWGRAQLLGAAAKVLGGGVPAEAAQAAEAAAKALVDDWLGREMAILIRLIAGQDVSAEAKALAERQESFSTRRYDEL